MNVLLQDPRAWVAMSMALGLAGANLLWLGLRQDRQGRLAGWLGSQPGLTVAWLARLAWLILPGYAALLLGLASPRLMGLTQVDWGGGFGRGLLFALLAWVILLAVGLVYRRSLGEPPPRVSFADALAGSARRLLEAGGLQWHWAFYRAVAIEAAMAGKASDPLAAGTALAVALVGLEGGLSLLLWRDLGQPGRAERRILRGALLVATSVLYLVSPNIWLGWILHASSIALLEPRLVVGSKKGYRASS